MKKITLLFLMVLFCQASYAGDPPWKAVWIGKEQCQSTPNQWLCFKKNFDVTELPTEAVARIAADSKYWMWINGEMAVFEGSLKRGPAPGATYYDKVDIAPYLREGENTVAVLVWFFGKNGFSHANSGLAGLLFDCQTPGFTLLSDDTWSCDFYEAYSGTEAPHPNFRIPESNIRFDARLEKKGWYLPGSRYTDGRSMMVADPGKPPYGPLVERPIPMWADYGMREYEDIYEVGDTLFCILPYNCHITPWLHITTSNAGQTIGMLTDNYTAGNSSNYSVRAEYITREGEQQYESLGWMNGQVMKYIIPEGVQVLGLKYRETGYNTQFAGSFACDDEFYNELWEKAARTLYVNMRDTYYDCPERERAQWWGDVVNELAQTFYSLDPDSYKLTEKAIMELINWQRDDGVIFAPVPAGNWTRELPLQMLASVGWYGFYHHYFYSGNNSFIPVIYDRLNRYIMEVWQMGSDGLVVSRDGEWAWGDWGDNIDMEVLTNCWYYLALKAHREFAAIAGRKNDIPKVEARMKSIEANFDHKFWTGTVYRDPAYTEKDDDRAQAMSVLSGLASLDKYPAIASFLKENYHAGPYMERFILEALFEMGEEDLAMERMKKRYVNMIGNEYSTLFEVWSYKSTPTDNNTNNHAWTGGPLPLLSGYVCGVRPSSPGFSTFIIEPQMGPLRQASTKVPAICGNIEVSVKRSGKDLIIDAIVPAGTTAEVRFPSGKTQELSSGTHKVKGR